MDCRTCTNHSGKHWPGHCRSTAQCVDGSAYAASAPVALWRSADAPAARHIAHKIEALGYTMQAMAERVRYYAGFNAERREWAHKLETAGAIVQGWGLSWCTKCGGTMAPGVAMGQTATGSPDELGGDVVTMSPGGPGKLIDCLKCSGCGHSVSV